MEMVKGQGPPVYLHYAAAEIKMLVYSKRKNCMLDLLNVTVTDSMKLAQGQIQTLTKGVLKCEGLYSGKATVTLALQLWGWVREEVALSHAKCGS